MNPNPHRIDFKQARDRKPAIEQAEAWTAEQAKRLKVSDGVILRPTSFGGWVLHGR